jgi:hypothetical protein
MSSGVGYTTGLGVSHRAPAYTAARTDGSPTGSIVFNDKQHINWPFSGGHPILPGRRPPAWFLQSFQWSVEALTPQVGHPTADENICVPEG